MYSRSSASCARTWSAAVERVPDSPQFRAVIRRAAWSPPTTFAQSWRLVAASLRQLADRLEGLPLEDAAEALVWLQDGLEHLRREAERILWGATGKYSPGSE